MNIAGSCSACCGQQPQDTVQPGSLQHLSLEEVIPSLGRCFYLSLFNFMTFLLTYFSILFSFLRFFRGTLKYFVYYQFQRRTLCLYLMKKIRAKSNWKENFKCNTEIHMVIVDAMVKVGNKGQYDMLPLALLWFQSHQYDIFFQVKMVCSGNYCCLDA